MFAAAEADTSTAAETFLRAVLGNEGWGTFPEPAQRKFTANGPAIVAKLRGDFLDGTEDPPGLLLARAGRPASTTRCP